MSVTKPKRSRSRFPFGRFTSKESLTRCDPFRLERPAVSTNGRFRSARRMLPLRIVDRETVRTRTLFAKIYLVRVKMILPALTEATSPLFRPIKYSLFPPPGLATLAAHCTDADAISLQDEHVERLD